MTNKNSARNLKGVPSSVNNSTNKYDYKELFDKLKNFKV